MTLKPRPLTPRMAPAFLLAAALALAAGCSGGGQLSVRSAAGEPIELGGDFTTGVYAIDDNNHLHVLLIEGPVDAPTQAVHVRMYWIPVAGKTPVDRRSTNATVRYMVFTGENAGVYAGAGLLFPNNKPGGSTFHGSLRSTSLRLDDASADFVDRLGVAEATGGFSARLDDVGTMRQLRQLERELHQKLGYPRFVMAE